MKQEPLSATVVTLSLQRRLGPNVNQGPFIVMMVDGEQYIMLTIKKNIMAPGIIKALQNDFNVPKAMIGMAFNERDSIQAGRLVTSPDPTVVGIYVPFADFKGDVVNMIGK